MLTEQKREGVFIDQEVVGVFLTYKKKVFLFKRHPSKKYGGGLWALCAGGKEKGETDEEGAFRELREETGIVATSYVSEKVFYHYKEGHPASRFHVFHIDLEDEVDITLNNEHIEFGMFSYKETFSITLMDGEREIIDSWKEVIV